MLCPFCGDRRTEVLETVFRGHSTYRHRRCLYCKARFSTREKQVPLGSRAPEVAGEAAIAGHVSVSIQSYHIAGRAVSRYSIADLQKLRGMLKAIV